jgi:F-type H+-transporting ATPase subunit a
MKPGLSCTRCAKRGEDVWALSGKHCFLCNHSCFTGEVIANPKPWSTVILVSVLALFAVLVLSWLYIGVNVSSINLERLFERNVNTSQLSQLNQILNCWQPSIEGQSNPVLNCRQPSIEGLSNPVLNCWQSKVENQSNEILNCWQHKSYNKNQDIYTTMYIVKNPLDQFQVIRFFSIDAPILANLRLSLTNIGVYLTIAGCVVIALNLLATNYNKIIVNNWSISQESIYATIHSIVINQINANKGQIYLPFIYVLFIFILVNNLIGMVPYSFASTSHFILTFFVSFTVVLGATILGFQKHGLKFFSLFVPSGCPLGLLPLLVLIEFISYLARNVSLGLRLAANILSGHMLLNILSGFAYNIMASGFVYFFVGLIPLAFIIAFSGLELGIAFIQAQVFVVLSSSYVKDALDLH